MKVDYKQLGLNIKDARNRQSLSQFDLADLTDMSPQYLSQIETGKKKASLQSLVNISTALKTTIDELLYGCYDSDSQEFRAEITSLLRNSNIYERTVMLKSLKALTDALQQSRPFFRH